MPEISAVVITFNEEKNIERCLDSIAGVADEIIVVDSFSTDRTEELCKKYNVRFIQNNFEGYIQQKNFAISKAKYSFVLSLDADEVLSPELQESILKVRDNPRYDGYYCKRLNYYCGKKIWFTSWYPDRKLRLWDKSMGKWGGNNPHDRVLMNKGIKTGRLKGHIQHYSFGSITEHIHQVNRFSSISARSYYNNGIRSGYLKMIFKPVWKFFRELFIKGGILQGYYGVVISAIMAFETFLKYLKLDEIYRSRIIMSDAIVFFNTSKSWGGGEQWHYQTALKFNELDYPVQVITNRGSDLCKRLREREIPLKQFRISNLSIFNPFKIYTIYRYLKGEKVSAVILNLSTDAKIGGLAAYLAGVPRIIYRRGLAAPISNTIFNRFFFRKIFTHVIANSEDTKKMILYNNPVLIPEQKITVIRNWIDIAPDVNLNSNLYYKKKGKEVVLGNLGRLVEVKAQDVLIKIAALLKSENIDFRVMIGGVGKLEKELRNYARGLNVENEVIFTGFVNQVKTFMKELDIFVLSSTYEGFGFVIAEAMLEKKPVVAFNTSSLPEIVRDGENGFLVPLGDIDAMLEKIKLLIADPCLAREMGENGSKMVREKFSFERQLPLLTGIFGLNHRDGKVLQGED
jgi:glycosyltransferase involved in cell wall biosynthesis